MDRNPASRLALLPLALLAGCATSAGEYPSLGIREAERVAGTLQPAPPAYVPPPPSAAALGQVDTLARQAEEAHQAFVAEAPRSSATVEAARGTSVGSESWARAEVALASLISARSRTMEPLADLDRLLVDAAVEGQDLARIAAARDAVEAHVAAEDAAIDRLQQMIAR